MSYIKPPAPIHSPIRTLAPDVHRAPQGPPQISSGANPTIYGPGSNGPKLPGNLTYPIRAVRNQEDREKMGKAADAKAEKAASKGGSESGAPPLGAPSTMPSGTAASGTLGRTAPPEPLALGAAPTSRGALGPGRSDEIHAKLMGMGAARSGPWGTLRGEPMHVAGALGTESHARASARSVINSGGDTPWGGNVRPQGSHGVQGALTNPDQARGALNEGPRHTAATGPRQGTGRSQGAVGTTSSTGNFDARLGSSPAGFERKNESGYRADNTTTTMRERMKSSAIETTGREVDTSVAPKVAKTRASRPKGAEAGGASSKKAAPKAPKGKFTGVV